MNTKKIIVSIVIAVLILVVLGLFYLLDDNRNQKTTIDSNQIVGNDKDEHGCIGSAGYSWCEAKKLCIRSWEEYCSEANQKSVVFTCDNEKTIGATFYLGDDKFVDLVLSDERKISVPRAISASGARYANADETSVFWNKGDTAFIMEGSENNQTFKDCIIKAE